MNSQNGSTSTTNLLEPHSIEAEESVLGAVLINPDALGEVSFLSPDDFFRVSHQWVYESFQKMRRRGDEITYVGTVKELESAGHLKEIGGAAFVLDLINRCESSLNAEGFARIVERMAIRRKLIRSAEKIARMAHSEETELDTVINQAVAEVSTVSNRRAVSMITTSKDVMTDCLAHLSNTDSGDIKAVKIGLDDIDFVTDGALTYGRFMTILGASGHFKTTILCQMTPGLATNGPVLWVSQEMPGAEVMNRIACQMIKVSSLEMFKGTFAPQSPERVAYLEALVKLSDMPIEFLCRQVGVGDIKRYIVGMMNRYGGQPPIVLIDTINSLNGTTHSSGRTAGTAQVAADLDALKLDTGALVIGTIQQFIPTNEKDVTKLRPSRNNVMDAKALYHKSDIMIGTYNADAWRQEYGPSFTDNSVGNGELLIRAIKNRYGNPYRKRLVKRTDEVPAIIPGDARDKRSTASVTKVFSSQPELAVATA